DQGLRLAYAFNHEEAARSFTEATRLDPRCAMCWWGIAYAVGPNINMPVSPEAERTALAAIRRARELATKGHPAPERDYIEALVRRFGDPAGADRAARDSAYAASMAEVARLYPRDDDAQVLYADALLNLRPWNQWTREGMPQPGTLDAVAALERVLARTTSHAGACHFYIHAVEASPTPERAVACAERLASLMPGAGHLVHMPAHVYLRVGRYGDAARANIAAMAADERYFSGHGAHGTVYPMFYAPHNTHFLWSAYLFSGQSARALDAARTLERTVSVDAARAVPSLQAFLTTAVLTHARFGRWDAVLAEPAPAAGLTYARGMWHVARGLARAGTGDLALAGAELDSLRAVIAATPSDMIIIQNPAAGVLTVGALALESRIAAARGQVDAAVALLRDAIRREDAFTYDEPPPWYHSTRHLLGTTLLAAGRLAEAEAAFRDDLRAYRENGWSLAGLEQALRRQGRTREADEVAARLERAWREADVELK
ncbi:MAG TPA: hypothetical protein VEA99_02000, partial [Gemmatimonadaceae bacterium]|nr:hypothetical protein [Gemmatimonadaceae bacterium]